MKNKNKIEMTLVTLAIVLLISQSNVATDNNLITKNNVNITDSIHADSGVVKTSETYSTLIENLEMTQYIKIRIEPPFDPKPRDEY